MLQGFHPAEVLYHDCIFELVLKIVFLLLLIRPYDLF